ncbi:acyltransferase [Niabella sp.]|uniref:acyltransferase family protein n=1 Tax=Niabella sp. TaxID=1962976 RepID=UPI0026369BAF|nr:acyltransferase [Niabella sp.]
MRNTMAASEKLYGLDHLRALAILLVFLFHCLSFKHPEWMDRVAVVGWTGVDLFFVLSGFLIAGQLFAQLKNTGGIDVRAFFIKRFFRIIPPYFIVVAIYFCVPFFREREALDPLWKFLTFTRNFGLDLKHRGTFSHAWSLCIEEQFYLTLPFVLLLIHKLKSPVTCKVLFFLLLVLTVVFRWLSWNVWVVPVIDKDDFWLQWYRYIYYPTYTRLDGLLLGIGLAWLMHYAPFVQKRIRLNGNAFFLAGIPFLAAAYVVCQSPYSFPATIWGFLLIALGFTCWVAAAVAPGSFLYKKRLFVTEQLASLSFAIYLSHKGVIHITQVLLEKAGLAANSNRALLLAAINCILAGLLFRYLVERPCRQLRDILLKRRQDLHAVVSVQPATSAYPEPQIRP